MPPQLEHELEFELFPEGESAPRRIWQFITRRAVPKLKKLGMVARSIGLSTHPLPEPAVVQEPPPAIVVDDQRKKPKQGQYELESEWESGESDRAGAAALMEHFAHAAAEAETEEAADAYSGALVPAAARLASRGDGAILKSAPRLIQVLTGASRLLRQTPETRPLVRTLPAALRQTVAKAARQAADGKEPSPRAVARHLARSVAGTLNDPRRSTIALCRSQALERRYGK